MEIVKKGCKSKKGGMTALFIKVGKMDEGRIKRPADHSVGLKNKNNRNAVVVKVIIFKIVLFIQSHLHNYLI